MSQHIVLPALVEQCRSDPSLLNDLIPATLHPIAYCFVVKQLSPPLHTHTHIYIPCCKRRDIDGSKIRAGTFGVLHPSHSTRLLDESASGCSETTSHASVHWQNFPTSGKRLFNYSMLTDKVHRARKRTAGTLYEHEHLMHSRAKTLTNMQGGQSRRAVAFHWLHSAGNEGRKSVNIIIRLTTQPISVGFYLRHVFYLTTSPAPAVFSISISSATTTQLVVPLFPLAFSLLPSFCLHHTRSR